MQRANVLLGLCAMSAAILSPGAASAGDIPYSVNLTPDEKLSGTVDQDDSSGEMNSAKGTASGPVSGDYAVSLTNLNTTLTATGVKLDVTFNRRDQQLRARLDTCATPATCTEGAWVIVWEKP